MKQSSAGRELRHAVLALGVGTLAALCGVLALGPTLALDDLTQRWLRPASQPAPVLVLGIDAGDPWPWRNDRLATLLQRLHAAGVRGIGLDLPIATGAMSDATGDARLAHALLEYQGVLGMDLAPQPDGALRARLPPVEFSEAARLGHLLLPRDRDGRIRRHQPQVLADDGIVWPSLVLALADSGGGADLDDADPDGDARDSWQISGTGDGPPTRSATHLLDGTMDPSLLRGQWVFVGLTDPARQARLPGPHGSAALFPVQHQARALAALLQGDTSRPLPPAVQALLALLLAAGATYAGLARNGPGWRMPVALLAGIVTTLALSAWLQGHRHWFAPGAIVAVLVLVLAAWAVITLHRQWRARRRLPGVATRRQLHTALQSAAGAGAAHALLLLDYSLPGAHNRGAGDACALQVAELLCTRARRPDDVAAWLDGCRFALLLHGTSADAAAGMLEQIHAQATDHGLALQGRMHACDTQRCDCLRALAAHTATAR